MESSKKELDKLVDHLFRREAGKLVATLTRLFGLSEIELAEDIVQDTLLTALHHWSNSEIPENPAAWITQVAKNKALNALKKRQTIQKHQNRLLDGFGLEIQRIDEIFLEKEIEDSQLRMIFTCCHPALPLPSQIALTLKTLCGFGVREIALALLTNEGTINKRLYRARQKIRKQEICFNIPNGEQLNPRLKVVMLALYLLFNEGYNASHPKDLIRKDLCLEAMRLTRLLIEQFPQEPGLNALLALMCFHTARFDSRLDLEGAIVIFEDQDRSSWNQELIAKGMQYLQKASKGKILTSYHLEAGIAAEHCLAQSFEDTNWRSIYDQYQKLYQLKKNPIIRLNLAIITSQISGLEVALDLLDDLTADKSLQAYYLLPATQGIFCLKLHRKNEARYYFLKAKHLTKSKQELDFLQKHLDLC